MNWTSVLSPSTEAPRLVGTVREHICADDFNKERASSGQGQREDPRDDCGEEKWAHRFALIPWTGRKS